MTKFSSPSANPMLAEEAKPAAVTRVPRTKTAAGTLSGRSVPEWIGRTPDSKIPARVRVRVFMRDDGRCQCGCGRGITVGDKWQTDHRIALANGGENRERNLFTLLTAHHKVKTRADVAEKSKVARMRAKHLGIKSNRTIRAWRKFDGTAVFASKSR